MTKDGQDWGGLIIADLPRIGGYMAYIIFNLDDGRPGGASAIDGYRFTLWEAEPGVYRIRDPIPQRPINEFWLEEKSLFGLFDRGDNIEYRELLFEFQGSGKRAVLDSMKELRRVERNLGPPGSVVIKDESVLEDLKRFDITLP